MSIELPIITIGVLLTLLLYIITTILYAIKNKWYYENMEKLNPMMYEKKYSYKKTLAIMIGTTLALVITTVGLFFFVSQLWPIIVVLLFSLNEAYRGATYYIKMGSYSESVKHMVIHGMVSGYLVSWFVFTVLPGFLPAWLLVFLF